MVILGLLAFIMLVFAVDNSTNSHQRLCNTVSQPYGPAIWYKPRDCAKNTYFHQYNSIGVTKKFFNQDMVYKLQTTTNFAKFEFDGILHHQHTSTESSTHNYDSRSLSTLTTPYKQFNQQHSSNSSFQNVW